MQTFGFFFKISTTFSIHFDSFVVINLFYSIVVVDVLSVLDYFIEHV